MYHHSIPHRFTATMKISNTCNICAKQIFFGGYKCRHCKYYCHSDCVQQAANSCGLPDKLLSEFTKLRKSMDNLDSFDDNNDQLTQMSITSIMKFNSSLQTEGGEVDKNSDEGYLLSPNQYFYEDECRPKSLIPREWNISFDELVIEQLVGTGRFGTVYRGNWHGVVAVKQLHTSAVSTVRQSLALFESFQEAVAIYQKTRHENLVLFIGASAKPPQHYAIITAFCAGSTLYTYIHVKQERFNLNRIVSICKQICLGMGYLHGREIIHQDLKTKNIFVENGKVVITDFGAFATSASISAKCTPTKETSISIAKGYLCYLAPEIIRNLDIFNQNNVTFTFATDIYSFGTILYELLFGQWPFSSTPAEVVIWQVGRGIKQPLNNLQASKEAKDLLALCWSHLPDTRPDFGRCLPELLSKLPKLSSSGYPSHPVNLFKSIAIEIASI